MKEDGNTNAYTAVDCQSACKNWNDIAYTYFAILDGGHCACDNDWENIIKHGKIISSGFDVYESIFTNTIYIQNDAVHHEWVGSAIANPILSTNVLNQNLS